MLGRSVNDMLLASAAGALSAAIWRTRATGWTISRCGRWFRSTCAVRATKTNSATVLVWWLWSCRSESKIRWRGLYETRDGMEALKGQCRRYADTVDSRRRRHGAKIVQQQILDLLANKATKKS